MAELRSTPMMIDCPCCDERLTVWVHFDVQGSDPVPEFTRDADGKRLYSGWKMDVKFPDFEEVWTHLSGAHGLLRVANPKGVLDV